MDNPEKTKQAQNVNENMMASQASTVQSATDAYMGMFRNFSRIQAEMLQFMTERMQKDFAHPLKLMECRKPEDFVQAQIDFANTMFADYAREGRSISELLRQQMPGRNP
jgi:hypothetical protein